MKLAKGQAEALLPILDNWARGQEMNPAITRLAVMMACSAFSAPATLSTLEYTDALLETTLSHLELRNRAQERFPMSDDFKAVTALIAEQLGAHLNARRND